MRECHIRKIATGGLNNNNIQDFLKKVCSDGIPRAAANFKKYLLLKKKYLDIVSELSYNYRDMVESNKKKQSKLLKN
jgi:hypothetical protein